MFDFRVTDLLFRLPAIVVSLSFHEFSHGYSAYLLGDNTARNMGRLSVNPLRHLDPFGFISLLLFGFGWAKPVPVNPYAFRSVDGKTGMLLTAMAGPMSNILLCFICVGALSLIPLRVLYAASWFYGFLTYMIWINASLAFFNLIPVPPLDGSKILFGLFPDRLYYAVSVLDRFGFLFLMLLLMSGFPGLILEPLSRGLIASFYQFFRLFA